MESPPAAGERCKQLPSIPHCLAGELVQVKCTAGTKALKEGVKSLHQVGSIIHSCFGILGSLGFPPPKKSISKTLATFSPGCWKVEPLFPSMEPFIHLQVCHQRPMAAMHPSRKHKGARKPMSRLGLLLYQHLLNKMNPVSCKRQVRVRDGRLSAAIVIQPGHC